MLRDPWRQWLAEARTAIAWGVGVKGRKTEQLRARGLHSLEGNMCGTARRGADALPRSKATSRAKGSHRNLGDLVSGRRRRVLVCTAVRIGKAWSRSRMMHGHEKSDLVIVAMTPANVRKRSKPTAEASAGANAAESVERRAGAKGNTHQHNTYWTQSQARVTNALERIRPLSPSHTRGGSRMRESRTYGSVRGGCDETHVPTATPPRVHRAARRRGRGVAGRDARTRGRCGWLAFSTVLRPQNSALALVYFRDGLAERGYIEGDDAAVEYRWGIGTVRPIAGYRG